MPIRVFIVDDSSFFRRLMRGILAADPGFQMVGEAKNGREAVAMVGRLKPDVVTMDVEMPVMGGIAAVSEIMACAPTKILMISSLTQKGAQFTLDALSAGAVDFITKDARGGDCASDTFADQLLAKLRQVYHLSTVQSHIVSPRVNQRSPRPPPRVKGAVGRVNHSGQAGVKAGDRRLLLIGASTGGPAALQKIIPALPADFPMPVAVIQHMPAGFTEAFAKRLDGYSDVFVQHAENHMTLQAGHVYIAPGGQQMNIGKRGHDLTIQVSEPNADQIYRPCIDIALSSAAKVVGRSALAIILTGMGADGREGVRALKQQGARIWAQDEASSVIYGMPMAVAKAGLADEVYSLSHIVELLARRDASWTS